MTQIDMQQTVVSALHRIGPMLKADLLDMTKVGARELASYLKSGLVKEIEAYGNTTYAVTNKGCRMYNLTPKQTRITPSKMFTPSGTYDGADLRPFTGRKGCNDAFALPSRGYSC